MSGDDEELERILDVPFVLWACPKGCRGMVSWNEASTVATCRECGQISDRRAGAVGDEEGRQWSAKTPPSPHGCGDGGHALEGERR